MKTLVIACLTTLFVAACTQSADVNGNQAVSGEQLASKDLSFEHEGFECIGEFEQNIELLGRGTDFPEFMLRDINQELVRQDGDSRLISAKCMEQPALKAGFVDMTIENEPTRSLDTLMVTFPLEIFADTGSELWYMDIEMGYTVTGLVSAERPTVTKNFTVLQTYNEDRKPLSKIEVIVRDEASEVTQKSDQQ